MRNKVLPNENIKIRKLSDGQYLLEYPVYTETGNGCIAEGEYSICHRTFRSLIKELKEIFLEA